MIGSVYPMVTEVASALVSQEASRLSPSTHTEVSASVVMPVVLKTREVLRHLEIWHRSTHLEHLPASHGLASKMAQGVVDGFTFRFQVVTHHDNVDQFIVDFNIGSPHVD
jgi:hypothetical protein